MDYVRLFVSLRDDPKVIGLPDKAFRAYVNALMWCGDRETDGAIPRGLEPDKVAAQLVEAGLWHPDPAGDGFRLPWEKYQFTHVQMERKRAGGRKAADARWNADRNSARSTERNGSRIARGNPEPNAERIAGRNTEVEEEVLGSELGSSVELGTAVGKELPPAASAAESDPFDASRWEHLLSTLIEHRGWPESGRGACTWKFLMLMRQRYGSAVVISALCDVQLDRVPPMSTAAGYFQSTCERFSAAVSA